MRRPTTTAITTTTPTDDPDEQVSRPRRRLPTLPRRPAVCVAAAAAGAVLVGVVVGTEPPAQAGAGTPAPMSVAEHLGVSAQAGPVDGSDLRQLEELAASRSSREDAQVAAQQAQAAADQAELDRQRVAAEEAARAEAERIEAERIEAERIEAERIAAERLEAERAAAERAAAEAAERAQAEASAAAAAAAAKAPASRVPGAPAAVSATTATVVAKISNSFGNVRPRAQAAANAVVSNVPGAAGLTIGGTRASATDPDGHPSGLALDYMVGSRAALGDTIAAYQIAHWAELGVEYVIWQQRILSSPTGAWKAMENRGSATANHFDHVHVNYRAG